MSNTLFHIGRLAIASATLSALAACGGGEVLGLASMASGGGSSSSTVKTSSTATTATTASSGSSSSSGSATDADDGSNVALNTASGGSTAATTTTSTASTTTADTSSSGTAASTASGSSTAPTTSTTAADTSSSGTAASTASGSSTAPTTSTTAADTSSSGTAASTASGSSTASTASTTAADTSSSGTAASTTAASTTAASTSAATTTAATTTTTSTSSTATAGVCSGSAPAAGTYNDSVTVNGTTRTFSYVITGTPAAGEALPVQFTFHGAGGAGGSMLWLGIANGSIAYGQNSITVAPNGLVQYNYTYGWDLSGTGVDVQFFDAMLAYLKTKFCVDTNHVFASGFSWGAEFTHVLGCYRGSVLKAIAPYSGSDPTMSGCGQLPAMRTTFSANNTDAYSNDSLMAAVNHYRDAQGCSSATVASNPGTNCVTFTGCRKEVTYCAVPGLGHAVVSTEPTDTWAFFRRNW